VTIQTLLEKVVLLFFSQLYTRKNENLLWWSDRNEWYTNRNWFGRKSGESVTLFQICSFGTLQLSTGASCRHRHFQLQRAECASLRKCIHKHNKIYNVSSRNLVSRSFTSLRGIFAWYNLLTKCCSAAHKSCGCYSRVLCWRW